MKKLIFILLFILPSLAFAQKSSIAGYLGKTSDELIKTENLISDPQFMQATLISAKILKSGYLRIVYRTTIDSTENSLEVYYFNKNNICIANKSVQFLKDYTTELKRLIDFGFYEVTPTTLYHKEENVKIIHSTDVKNNQCVFVYMRKTTANVFD